MEKLSFYCDDTSKRLKLEKCPCVPTFHFPPSDQGGSAKTWGGVVSFWRGHKAKGSLAVLWTLGSGDV